MPSFAPTCVPSAVCGASMARPGRSSGKSWRRARKRPVRIRCWKFSVQDLSAFMFGSKSKPTDANEQPLGFFGRLRQGLGRSAARLTEGLASFLPGGKIDADVLDELESRLITADVGVETTTTILASLRDQVARKELGDLAALLAALRKSMLGILEPVAQPLTIDA